MDCPRSRAKGLGSLSPVQRAGFTTVPQSPLRRPNGARYLRPGPSLARPFRPPSARTQTFNPGRCPGLRKGGPLGLNSACKLPSSADTVALGVCRLRARGEERPGITRRKRRALRGLSGFRRDRRDGEPVAVARGALGTSIVKEPAGRPRCNRFQRFSGRETATPRVRRLNRHRSRLLFSIQTCVRGQGACFELLSRISSIHAAVLSTPQGVFLGFRRSGAARGSCGREEQVETAQEGSTALIPQREWLFPHLFEPFPVGNESRMGMCKAKKAQDASFPALRLSFPRGNGAFPTGNEAFPAGNASFPLGNG